MVVGFLFVYRIMNSDLNVLLLFVCMFVCVCVDVCVCVCMLNDEYKVMRRHS